MFLKKEPEELRETIISRIDALLARTLLVWGEDRAILSAVRGYMSVMPEQELQRLLTFFHERKGNGQEEVEGSQEGT